MVDKTKVIVCGFGRVGREFARLIHEKSERMRAAYGMEAVIVGIGELNGSLHRPDGIDPVATADAFEREGGFGGHPNLKADWRGLDLVRAASADALIETTPTDTRTGEPAMSHIHEALRRGMHVVSANKGPFIRAYRELTGLAKERNAVLKISAAAAAALPTIDVAETCLAGAEILRVEGVLNGTTNFILSRMRTDGQSYEDALAEAQALGIAETDPTLDVEGFDTANKLALITNVCMGADLTPDDVERTGIAGVSLDEVQSASAERERSCVSWAPRSGMRPGAYRPASRPRFSRPIIPWRASRGRRRESPTRAIRWIASPSWAARATRAAPPQHS